MNVPYHIAIIPDGNRRWAKKRHLSNSLGHEEGVKALESVLKAVFDLHITCFSFWGASEANLAKRSPKEVRDLEKMYEINFKKLAKDKRIHEEQVRVNILGHWENSLKRESAKRSMRMAIKATGKYDRYLLNFFIAYDGISDMLSAIEKIACEIQRTPGLAVTAELVKANLFTYGLPPVDLLIRTGGEPHLSAGFMMWDIADSQLYFSEKYWPEFTGEDLKKAIADFQKRQRRYGK